MFGENDYPYFTPPNDPFGYAIRQCASFANWRCWQDLGTKPIENPNGTNNGGQFAAFLGTLGYKTGTVPHEHDIMSLPPGVQGAGQYGHVCVVLQILDNGALLVEDYNWYDDLQYHQHQLVTAGALFATIPTEDDDMAVALLQRNDNTQDPHGPGALYLCSGARVDGNFIPLVKRHIVTPQDEKFYTDAGMAVEKISGYILDRAEDGPPVQGGSYPTEQ